MERRNGEIFKSFLLPIVTSVVASVFIGTGASFIATKMTVKVLETEISMLKEIGANTSKSMRSLDQLVIKLDSQKNGLTMVTDRLKDIETEIVLIKQTAYTQVDANKDQELMRFKIINELKKHENNQ